MSARDMAAVVTAWLTDGTPEKIVLDALQEIAFGDPGVDPRSIALEALHGAGFASLKTTYSGAFDLNWLRAGETVQSAGDGSGAALIVHPCGIQERVSIGDEIWLDRARQVCNLCHPRRPVHALKSDGGGTLAGSCLLSTAEVSLAIDAVAAQILSRNEGQEFAPLLRKLQEAYTLRSGPNFVTRERSR